MSSSANIGRLQGLFAPRSARKAVRRRRADRIVADRTPFSAVESLESRAMLAVSHIFDQDWVKTDGVPYGTVGAQHTYSDTKNGAVVIDMTGAGDRLFMRVKNNVYQFAEDSNFTTGLFTYNSTYSEQVDRITTDPDATKVPAVAAKTTPFTYNFTTIVVRAQGIDPTTAAGPTFEVVGGSETIRKTLIVDLQADDNSPLSQSSIRIGAPVVVPVTTAFSGNFDGNGKYGTAIRTGLGAGDVYLAAESVTISAAVTSANDVFIDSQVGSNAANAGNPTGVAVNASIVAPGDVQVDVSGANNATANFSLKAGSEIGNGGANSAAFTLALQNANAAIGGNVRALNHFITLESTAPGVVAQSMSLTTLSSTGSQTGRLFGTNMVLYLNNDVADGAAAPGSVQDGSIDIRTKVADLRVTAAPQTTPVPLNYAIKVRNNANLSLPAVISSNGLIDIGTTDAGNAVTLSAAIDTPGSFSLSSDDDVVVTNPINAAKNIVISAGRAKNGLLTAINGDITINAPVTSALGGTQNAITLSSIGGDVKINELVESVVGSGVAVTTTGAGRIITESFARNDPNSRLAGSSVTLSAGGGIDVGTQTSTLSAAVTGAGNLVITNDGNFGNLLVTKAQTTSGSISLTARDTIQLAPNSLVAGGDPTVANPTLGDVTIASTQGSIDLSQVTVQASKNTVTLTQGSFDTDGVTPLGGSAAGQILGQFPVKANALVYSSFNVPQNNVGTESYVLFNNVPTISASLQQAGNLTFTAANGYASTVAVNLAALSTFDGDITLTNTGVGLTATNVVANSQQGNLRNVNLSGKSLVLGSVVAEGGAATLTSQFGITDDGNAATTSIVADTVTLTAGQTLQGDIGTAASPVELDAFTAGGTVALTASNLTKVGSINVSSNAATNLVDVRAINAVNVDATSDSSSDVTATLVYANDDDGTVVLRAGRDLTADDIQSNKGGAPALGANSKITLAAGRNLLNNGAPVDLVARSVSLTADSLTAFGFTALDTPTVVSAAASSTVQGDVTLDFDRAADVILDGVTTVNGNITVTNIHNAAGFLSIGTNGVTANGAGRSISIDTASGGGTASIGFDPQLVANAPATQTQGKLTTTGNIILTSGAAIDVITAGVAGQSTAVQATSANGDINLVHAVGNLSVATGGTGIKAQAGAGNVGLAVTNGSVVASTGVVTAALAAVSASQNVDVRTVAGSLAVQGGGNVTVQQNGAVSLATGTANDKTFSGIASTGAAGSVSLTANGPITGGGLLVGGNSVSIVQQLAATAIDLDTAATLLSATTPSGDITLRNTKTFGIGAAGINAGANNVTLTAQAATGPQTAAITAGTGTITGNAVNLTAEGGVAAKTNATNLNVTTTGTGAGDVSITQQGQALAATITTSNGGVTLTSNKAVTVTSIVATGSAKNVSITTTGAANAISLAAGSIIADGDRVTLTATGGVTGVNTTTAADLSAVTADVRSGSVVLSAGATSSITVQASNVQAAATAGDLNVTMTKTTTKTLPVVLGKATGQTLLSAPLGKVTIRAGQDLAVVDAPIASTLSYRAGNTGAGVVNFVANNSLGAGTGSFAQAITNSTAGNVAGGASGRVIFSTAVTSPIQLAATQTFTAPVSYDGRSRLNLTTGAIQTGNMVDIDGSRLAANSHGFVLGAGSAGSTISGFAFYGFSGTGAGVRVSAGNGQTIQGNLFGISSAGRAVSNGVGVDVSFGTGHTISGNTVVRGTTAGIRVQNSAQATISNNIVGTNASRVNLSNAIGIDLTGAGANNLVSNNVVGFNTTAGIRVNSTDTTTVSGNDVFLNAIGILVNGNSNGATLTGNTVTRSTGVGVQIGDTARAVTLGGATAASGNFIGTNANRALGLGNALSGVLISGTGASNTVRNNTIMGNGTSTLAANAQNRAGIRISAATPATLNIADNKIEQNRGSGVLVDNTSGAAGDIQRNLFVQNFRWGVNTNGVAVTLGAAGNVNTYRSNAFGTFTTAANNGQG